MTASPLSLDAATMKRYGYAVVDMLVERATGPRGPAIALASRDEMERRLRELPPEQGQAFSEILAQLEEDIIPFGIRFDHPRNFAYIPSSGTWPGALGDFIASAANLNTMFWKTSPGGSEAEALVLDWFKQWIGYPPEAGGVLVGGGSTANLTALACAREALIGAMSDHVVAYVSDQAHSSFARAARVLGFHPDQVRVLPVDEKFRLRPSDLAAAMTADVEAGRRPLFVAATAGTTNTGAVDPLPEIAALCRDRGAWFHVDGAYGGFSVLTERGKRALAGIELADSVTMDPHKWLYQPYECGAVLVRDASKLRDAFHISPDYLKDAAGDLAEVNFADLGLQLARGSRALKLWMSLKFFGVEAFRAAMDNALDLAEEAEQRIAASAELELLAPAVLGIVCFRRRFAGVQDDDAIDRLNRQLVASLDASGEAAISTTSLRGAFAIRMCVLNHTTTREDVMRVLGWIEQAPHPRIDDDVALDRDEGDRIETTRGWLAPPTTVEEALARVPLFRSLSAEQFERVAEAATERSAAPGETIIAQWENSRELYVILEGSVEVQADGQHIWDLGPRDFFGEFAVLDWGASFGYARLATVIATTPCWFVSLPTETVNDLMREVPSLERQIRRTVRRRLHAPA
jgi:aromatic-L-amino-acid/L-tryptophan decarboxylase